MLSTILIAVAFVLALCAALGVPSSRVNLGWLALAFYFLAMLLPGLVRLA